MTNLLEFFFLNIKMEAFHSYFIYTYHTFILFPKVFCDIYSMNETVDFHVIFMDGVQYF